jgi:diguanylate cyclase (GGDEF)-like protein
VLQAVIAPRSIGSLKVMVLTGTFCLITICIWAVSIQLIDLTGGVLGPRDNAAGYLSTMTGTPDLHGSDDAIADGGSDPLEPNLIEQYVRSSAKVEMSAKPLKATLSHAALLVSIPLSVWLSFLAFYLSRQQRQQIAKLKARELELQRLSRRHLLALKASAAGVWELDLSTGNLFWDERLKELFEAGEGREDFSLSDWQSAVHPDDLAAAESSFALAIKEEGIFSLSFRIVRKDGRIIHLKAYGIVENSDQGQRVVGINWDVSDDVGLREDLQRSREELERQNQVLRDAQSDLEYLSAHDTLTGLWNRRFLDRLSLDRCRVPGKRVAIIHMDLDNFKDINDSLGHDAGDLVLQEVAQRLRRSVRQDEEVVRVGGDEFVVVLQRDEPDARACEIAAEIISVIQGDFQVGGMPRRLGCSVGVAVQKSLSDTTASLLIDADLALYEAKRLGRGKYELFTSELKAANLMARSLEGELRDGVARGEFIPAFQPQFDAKTLEIVGAEALARWDHPQRGVLTPDKFLDAAESAGLLAEIDAIMLEKALFQSWRWRSQYLGCPKVSVNLSAQRLRDPRLLDCVRNSTFDPGQLSFELLETIAFEGKDNDLLYTIRELERANVEIEIDDFGSAQASIVSLIELAPKRLKIDRKLVSPITRSATQRQIVSSIIEMGKSQNIAIVAEGVETMEHVKILGGMGCDILQGFGLGRPMLADAFIDFILQWEQGRLERGAA